jgi:predicted RNase H-like HicB family nuclease
VPDLPGVLTYGSTRERAVAHAEALALHVIAERLENDEDVPDMANLSLVTA